MTAARIAAEDIAPVTIAAFDAYLETVPDPSLHELVEFDVIMMSNPTDIHEEIVANIAGPLKGAMQSRGCSVFIGGLRIQRSEDTSEGDKPRPDILVRCGPLTGRTFVIDPIVVVEVLSPSTMDIDRGRKLEFYKSLASMQHVVLVYQNERRIEHHARTAEGWRMLPLTGAADRLEIEAVAFGMDVAEIYRHVPI
jgi:Uma2 family endonuclease